VLHGAFALAGGLAGQGAVDQARRWYRAAVDTHHPDEAPRAMVNLGMLEAQQGKFDQADDWFSQAEATGHPEQVARARAEREKMRQRQAMRAYLPYLSPGNEDQTPFTPVLRPRDRTGRTLIPSWIRS
jgi:Tfp pilus assembly protein PilF